MKSNTVTFLMILTVMFLTGVRHTAAQEGLSNDNFAGATPVVLTDGIGTVAGNNTGATKETGEPVHAENVGGCSVWFSFTPTVTKAIRVNTMDHQFDTLLAVYTGTDVNNLELVGYNNDRGSDPAQGSASTVDVMMTAGTTYMIAIDGLYYEGDIGSGPFTIALIEFDAAGNDGFSNAYDLGLRDKGSFAGTNFNASIEQGEPVAHYSNDNGRSVWYRWKAPANFSVTFEVADTFDSQLGVFTTEHGSPTFQQLTKVADNRDGNGYVGRYRVRFFAEVDRTYYLKVDWHNSNLPHIEEGNFQLKFYPNRVKYWAGLNNHGQQASVSLFRPSDGHWYHVPAIRSAYAFSDIWGINGDTPVAADFNGDGRSELAAIRNQNGKKLWYIKQPIGFSTIPWGLDSDKPVTGDFDLDGRADLGVIRNTANGYVWYIRKSSNGGLRTFNFGTTGDRPVLGDFDGDGYTDVTVIRNTQNGLVWYMLMSGDNVGPVYTSFATLQFGTSPDVPAAQDFDGDGATTSPCFGHRPATGTSWAAKPARCR